MGFGVVDATLVVVHPNTQPTDEDWGRFLEFCFSDADRTHSVKRGVVLTPGAAPSNHQRRAQRDALRDAGVEGSIDIPMALLTDSRIVRTVATAVSFFTGQSFKAFSPLDVHLGLDYIGVSAGSRENVRPKQ